MYALAEDAFDQQATRRGSLFTELAATVLGNAQVLASLKSHNERLHAALNNRAPIDQAIGILMCRTGISPQEAFDRLKKISQNEHQKVHRVAATFVEQARRAATRPSRNDQVTAR